MRAVIQRVSSAGVTVDGVSIAAIQRGLLVLVGSEVGDTQADISYIVEKTAHIRIFEDENDKMNLSVTDVGGELLIVSQFTLMGDARKGRRPGFTRAGSPDDARAVYEKTIEAFAATGIKMQQGQFQADMKVSLVNDGPVTILLDSRKIF